MQEVSIVGYDINVKFPLTSFIEVIGLSGYIECYSDIVIFLDDPENASNVLDHTKAVIEGRHDIRGENKIMVMDYNQILSVLSK